ncbi:MAG TPA: hypothetical protein VIA61_00270 [Methylomirabilota bacterium]|jgi:hypothetical protein
MRATRSIRTGISIGLVVVASLLLASCESADKAPAAAAISAAQSALDAIRGEAAKYVPSQVSAVESAIASAKAAFDKNDYKAALAGAQDAAAKAKDLAAAATAKKAELTKTWEDMSGGLPKMAEAIKSRVDILSQSKKLPAGLDKDKLEAAKAGLASLNQSWTEATDAAKAGNMSDAIAKGQAAKAKAVEAMTALNMQVPEAAK